MSELKICNMGHYYQQSLAECPYCPKQSSMSTSGPTVIENLNQGNSHTEKTEVFGGSKGSGNQYGGGSEKTTILSGNKGSSIINDAQSPVRKLVGWLVTFNRNPNGKDYKIYEGRNVIGSQKGNDILIDFDNTISSKHLTILFRANEFLFQDELSTNGTFVNGLMQNSGSLKDGDIIKVAETEFLFRTAFKQL